MQRGPLPFASFPTTDTPQNLRVCIVFEDATNADSAEVLIKHAAEGYGFETQSYSFKELQDDSAALHAARKASDADILIVAVRGEQLFPARVQYWLELWLNLRRTEKVEALVVLLETRVESGEESPLFDYLATFTAASRLAFLQRPRERRKVSRRTTLPGTSQRSGRSGSISTPRVRRLTVNESPFLNN